MAISGGGGGDDDGVEVKRAFIGAGCNRIVNNVSFSASDLVAFGSQNAVAIFSPKVPPFFLLILQIFCSSLPWFVAECKRISFCFGCRLLRFWLRFRDTRPLSTALTGFLVLNFLSKVFLFLYFFVFFPLYALRICSFLLCFIAEK